MPELPEVEIVRQSLNKKIKHKKILRVIIRNRNLRFKIPLNFESYLKKKKIIKVDRYSKYLILNISDNSFCMIHLGMSGTIHIIDKKKLSRLTNTSFYKSPFLPKKHNHVEIIFNNFRVIYNDPRRFGFIQIIKNKEELKKRFKYLGPEPFDNKFNTDYVYNYFNKRKKNIKNFLIDQNFVSGIGNIYANEILFLSKINPSKNANLLSKPDCNRIIYYSRKVLLKAIEKGGSSIQNFKNTSGVEGNFQKNFNVYQREGLVCKTNGCTNLISKNIISKRSTFFCNSCQK
ncbi:MAG: bifunctional DNA-formamidopyrimidine glycosylase/DNA-(apurinic or apyrimidinic site) lyase [Alphaproteobacteria bacterium]|nr:bifunctional DNA-formamidopyrimidine glycosylase/DNA-(apurinic or apyrimidinic site) lyase [Alphaproteobacteria bacterium]